MSLARYFVAGTSLVACHLSATAPLQICEPVSQAIVSTSMESSNSPDLSHEITSNTQSFKAASLSPSQSGTVQYGQVTGKRVRMRVAAQLDAPVVFELDKDTPLEITGETEEFYAVRSPKPMKAYVFRTYVLDGKIEGERVNVRLEPSPQATIVTQLNSGTPVQGAPSAQNSKWLEIDLPASVRFYISKDYVQTIDRNRFEILSNQLFQKNSTPAPIEPKLPEVAVQALIPSKPASTSTTQASASRWQLQEQALQQAWLKNHETATEKDYQTWQTLMTKTLQGELDHYDVPVTAPGDFVLRQGGRIIAIVYSPNVNLSDFKGNKVKVQAVERDNNSFAYPAYCILSIERLSE